MLDRLALLDRSSAALFQILCDLTYDIEVSDGRNYSVPLYIRDTELCKMVHNTCIDFTEEDVMLYKNYFSINDRVLHGSEIEEEFEVLQEIGWELYKALKKQIVKPLFFLKLVESFMDYGEFRNSGDEEQSVEHMENI